MLEKRALSVLKQSALSKLECWCWSKGRHQCWVLKLMAPGVSSIVGADSALSVVAVGEIRDPLEH